MAFDQSKHLFTGMSRDLSDDKMKAEYYIDAHNIRITAREDTSLLSVTNEKGNVKLEIAGEGDSVEEQNNNKYIAGQYIGHAVLNSYLVIFNIAANNDYIWRIDLSDPLFPTSKCLYKGKLGFEREHPIETLADFETEEIQKVYWTDGINQPRMINIVNTYGEYTGYSIDNQFDFVRKVFPDRTLNDRLNVSVEKLLNTEGIFAAGTIQYFITYYNKFGQESNVVWQSPLLYTSPQYRGGSPNETVSNSFKITIENPIKSFDYVRIYAVQHTSEDTALIGRIVIDLPISQTDDSISYIDNGTSGDSINPPDLYYKGGVPVAIGTMTTKDQVLFLGNITLKSTTVIPDNIKRKIRNDISNDLSYINVECYDVEKPENKYYDYDNQLNYTSWDITTLKYNETYRFGLQFQDRLGRWSEPVFLKDLKNDKHYPIQTTSLQGDEKRSLVKAYLRLTDADLIAELINLNYIRVRPVIVFPSENERECIAQGVLNPTVYNVQDRLDNSPFAQPSWFFRPYWPIDWPYNIQKWQIRVDENHAFSLLKDDVLNANYGTLLPYAHNGLILGGTSKRGEIEKSYNIQGYYIGENKIRRSKESKDVSIIDGTYDIFFSGYEEVDLTQISNPKDFYYIDQSLITLNSPEIDFGNILSTDGLAFRIVGALNVTGFYGTMSLETQNSPNSFFEDHGSGPTDTGVVAYGFYKKDVYIKNYGATGYRVFGNGPYWVDVPYINWGSTNPFRPELCKPANVGFNFIIYPWQSTGSLGGGSFNVSDVTQPLNGELRHKTISNIRYSPETVYTNSPLNYTTSDIQFTDNISKSTITLNISEDVGYKTNKVFYYSNIDKLLSVPEHNNSKHQYVEEDYSYDIMVAHGSYTKTRKPTNDHDAYSFLRREFNPSTNTSSDGNISYAFHKKFTATSITYKSSPHAVIALTPKNDELANIIEYPILPSVVGNDKEYGTIPEYRTDKNDITKHGLTGDHNIISKIETSDENLYRSITHSFWQTNYPTNYVSPYITQNKLNILNKFKHEGGILLIGEIYRPESSIVNRFGGDSEDALQQNIWIPAGKSQRLVQGIDIYWMEGDTYFQRYDCLKTYPYSNENENNIVEILSFLCETRINIAGRYDKNRGLNDNTFITNENFNLINTVYNQRNNFFTYRMLDSRFDASKFKNQITWTKVKSAGALVDNWTNITLANTLDLDGDKGEVVSLNKFRNDVIAFQPRGISQIMYNSNVQINTSNGLPIELANSGVVNGKRYLYEGIGCQNKWSICDEVPSTLYFIDNLSKCIYEIGSELKALTDVKGFRKWMGDNNTIEPWTPYPTTSPLSFRTFYDKTYKDIYFVNHDVCLVYSVTLQQFVSFMSYSQTDAMFNVNDNFYSMYGSDIWHQFEGEYNNIYNQIQNYDITFIENQNPEISKIFTNLEYRSDTYKFNNSTLDYDLMDFETFDTVRVYNEYQDTDEQPVNKLIGIPEISSLQKKFRIWRLQIPRDKDNWNNRISNTWTKVTLKKNVVSLPTKNKQTNIKTELHDAIVGYYF